MDQGLRNKLRDTVLQARKLLETSINEILQGRFGIYPAKNKGPTTRDIVVEDDARMGHLEPDQRETRQRLLEHLNVLQSGGLSPQAALDAFVRETAFTWLNRFVAFKMLEARNLIRETVSRLEDSNGFKMWLAEAGNEDHLANYQKGDLPQNGWGEGPRQKAYRAFILAQCRKLSEEVRVLFDPDALVSRFLPQPNVLKELANLLNHPDLVPAWQPGNEETIGWVYQGFNEVDLEPLRGLSSFKIPKELLPAKTQKFTLRWVVKYLVQNTLGRLWLELHPDSQLASSLDYLVPLPNVHRRPPTVKSVKDITFLDPACGTMHFGLVAFDLFVEMYREEMANAGKPGWPEKPPVPSAEDIPNAIIAHNLHGIDIDPRAVQLSALTLYLKAKTLNPKAKITESRLACANIRMLDGEHLKAFCQQAGLGPVYQRILGELQKRLKDSEQLGSLLRLEEEIRQLVATERSRYEREGAPYFPGWAQEQFETEAGRREFWETLEAQIGQALDAFARQHAHAVEQTFFAGETAKGLRLLELMAQRYDVVVTNPPFLDSRDMNDELRKIINSTYAPAKRNLFAPFVMRCHELCKPAGYFALITGQTFMFIRTFEEFRKWITSRGNIESLLQFDYGLFHGIRVDTAAFVLRRENDPEARQNAVGTYFRLVKEPDSEAKRRRFEQALANLRAGKDDPIVYRYRQGDFDAIPGSPWVYWITPGLRNLFETFPKLGEIAQPRQGLATADNFRFLRYWWEAGTERIGFGCTSAEEAMKTGKRWFPHMKGGSFRRWYGNQEYVVNWERDGNEMKSFQPSVIRNPDYYFRRGVTWSHTTSARLSARLMPEGFIFNVEAPSCFPVKSVFAQTLACFNSSPIAFFANLINPTIHMTVGALSSVPVPTLSSDMLQYMVDQAIALAKADSEDSETTWDFIAPPDLPDGIQKVAERHAQLAEIERQIDEEVYRLYGISDEDRRAIEAELAAGGTTAENKDDEEPGDADAEETATTETFWSEENLAKAWISYAVGVVMGQFEPGKENGLGRGRFDPPTAQRLQAFRDQDGLLVNDPGHPDDLATRVLSALEVIFGEAKAEALIRTAVGQNGDLAAVLRDYLADKFFKEHLQKYRKRPIYWYLRSARGNYGLWLYYHRLDRDILYKALVNYVEPKIRQVSMQHTEGRQQLESAKQASDTRAVRRLEKELERFEGFLAELQDFAERLRRAADLRIDFDQNDGVILNLAPLWELVPWSEPKKYWEELQEGKYDWTHIAYQLWPERVKEKCKRDRSLAIAHGLEEVCEVNACETKMRAGRRKNH